MACFALVGVAAAAWFVSVALAIVGTITAGAAQLTTVPWLLLSIAVGITTTTWLAVERSRLIALRAVHAELEGEVSDQPHLSAV